MFYKKNNHSDYHRVDAVSHQYICIFGKANVVETVRPFEFGIFAAGDLDFYALSVAVGSPATEIGLSSNGRLVFRKHYS